MKLYSSRRWFVYQYTVTDLRLYQSVLLFVGYTIRLSSILDRKQQWITAPEEEKSRRILVLFPGLQIMRTNTFNNSRKQCIYTENIPSQAYITTIQPC